MIRRAADAFPAVVVLGARQVGKTTLARKAFPQYRYLDLEDPRTAQRFEQDPRFELDAALAQGGCVLDEAQAVPAVFSALRGAIDDHRHVKGRFIILGSAQPALVRAVSESLAGRAAVLEMDPLAAAECAHPQPSSGLAAVHWRDVWLRGGFPDAVTDSRSGGQGFRRWWDAYLRLVLERDLPQYGLRADPLFLRRLLTLLAHQQGGLLNASSLGSALGVTHHTLLRHLDMLEGVYLVRRLQPWFRNVGKRLTKSPKVYLRDTGLLHHLLNIGTHDELMSHPVRGASWETFVMEDVLRRERVAYPHGQAAFWRTAAGAEIDLLLERGHERVALEVKLGRGDRAHAVRVLRGSLPDVQADRAWIIDQAEGIEGVGGKIARAGFAAVLDGTP